MKVIYENDPNKWVENDGRLEIALATAGTHKETYQKDGPKDFCWSVSLVGGASHPLWGENFGDAETLLEAMQMATEFLEKVG